MSNAVNFPFQIQLDAASEATALPFRAWALSAEGARTGGDAYRLKVSAFCQTLSRAMRELALRATKSAKAAGSYRAMQQAVVAAGEGHGSWLFSADDRWTVNHRALENWLVTEPDAAVAWLLALALGVLPRLSEALSGPVPARLPARERGEALTRCS